MCTLAKVALFECERLLCFDFIEKSHVRQYSNTFDIALT